MLISSLDMFANCPNSCIVWSTYRDVFFVNNLSFSVIPPSLRECEAHMHDMTLLKSGPLLSGAIHACPETRNLSFSP